MKKRIVIALLLCAIALTSVLAFAACTPKELKGFDIELAQLVAEELGVEVKFQKIFWDSKETELSGKTIDLIWNGLTINDDRLEQFSISTPYMNNQQIAVIRKSDSSKYVTFDNIKSAKTEYEKGSAGQDVANDLGFTNALGLDGQVDALMEVKAGTSDVALLDSVLGNFYCNEDSQFSDLMVIPNIIFTVEQYGIAARKGDLGTIDKINTALATLQANGKLAELADKYSLKSQLCDVTYESKWDSLTDEEKSGWNYIQNKGSFTVGYTLYAPIAFF